jgi:dethiobiotin synthetase
MGQGIFITGTGTDVGKTYITALLAKKMKSYGLSIGYYKAALSGAANIKESDAGYVKSTANLQQEEDTLLSYLYQNPVSPHLAAKWEDNPVDLEKVKMDYQLVRERYDYTFTEGSGGIVCPIRYDDKEKFFLENIIKMLHLDTLIVADAGLGTINATVLTADYLKSRNISVSGVILNRYKGTAMEKDNLVMIEAITNLPVIALVRPGDTDLDIDKKTLLCLFKENK